jgi:transcriptional regulator with XRE-family HTH domain
MQLMNLGDVRRSRGISQSDLGRRIGVRQARIASIEGGTSVSRETAEKLAGALVCGVEDLVRANEPTITLKLSDVSPEVLALLKK